MQVFPKSNQQAGIYRARITYSKLGEAFCKREARSTVHTKESRSHSAGAGSAGEIGLTGDELGWGTRQDGDSEMQYFLTLVALGAPGRKEEASQQSQGSWWTRENRKVHTGSSHRPPWSQVPLGPWFFFIFPPHCVSAALILCFQACLDS